MDSLTQLALGAAVGEAVAGKKLGNKAMLWGALAGTIPDLDVVTGFWMNDIESMAFHRGITHSIAFSIVFPFVCAMLARLFYKQTFRQTHVYQIMWRVLWIILGSALLIGFSYIFILNLNAITFLLWFCAGSLGVYWIWRSIKEKNTPIKSISFRHWYIFFFLGFATHILIDAFTTYGTQIFQPFSNFRFTTSTISVADPFYTTPLLLFLILSSLYQRNESKRHLLNYIGLGLSSLYMLFTFINKSYVDKQFRNRLEELEISSDKYMTNPTILNNFLWHGIVETDTAYIESYYSLFDKKRPFQDIRILPKNRQLLAETGCAASTSLHTLTWFSDGYYNFSNIRDTTYYNDLRFGTLWMDDPSKPDKQVFYFRLDDACDAHEIRDTDEIGEAWDIFMRRVKGE